MIGENLAVKNKSSVTPRKMKCSFCTLRPFRQYCILCHAHYVSPNVKQLRECFKHWKAAFSLVLISIDGNEKKWWTLFLCVWNTRKKECIIKSRKSLKRHIIESSPLVSTLERVNVTAVTRIAMNKIKRGNCSSFTARLCMVGFYRGYDNSVH